MTTICLVALLALAVSGCSGVSDQANYDKKLVAANSFLQQGQLESALIQAQNLIEADPKRAEPYKVAGLGYFTAGDFDRAAQFLAKSIELGNQDPMVQYKRIDALLRLGRHDAAEQILSRFDDATAVAEILRLKGDLALYRNEQTQASKFYKLALEQESNNSASLLGLALIANASKDAEATERLLQDAIDSKVDFTQALLFKGYYLLNRREPEQAEAAFSQALSGLGRFDIMTNDKYRALQGLSKALLNQGRGEAALTYTKMMAKSPQGKVQARIKDAVEAYQAGDVEAAQADFESVLQLAPGHQMSHLALGMMKLKAGDVEAAERLLSKASLNNESLDIKTYKALTIARIRLGKTSEAVDILKQALRRFPNNADLMVLQASILAEDQRFDSANTLVEKVLAIDPDNAGALNLAASFAQANRDLIKARQLYSKSIASLPNLYASYRGLLSTYAQEPQAGLAAMTSLAAQNSESVSARTAVAAAQLLAGNHNQAIELGEQLVTAHKNDTNIRQVLAASYSQAGLQGVKNKNLEAAFAALARALELAPTLPTVTLFAQVAQESKKIEDASGVLAKVLEQYPQFAAGYETLGDLFYTQKDIEQALPLFRQAWSLRPNFQLAMKLFHAQRAAESDTKESAAVAIAHIERWQKQLSDASAQVDPVPEQLKQQIEASYFALASAYEILERTELAAARYEALIKLRPKSALYFNNLAWLKFTLDDTDALGLAARAYELAPQVPEIIDTYGWIMANQGKPIEGLKLLNLALEKAPNNREIQGHITAAQKM